MSRNGYTDGPDPGASVRLISFGAGVQSSTMALMAAKGDIGPMPDAAIFADTQNEPRKVYEWLLWIEAQLPFPVLRVTEGSIHDHVGRMPWFVDSGKAKEGILKRACSGRLKTRLLDKVGQVMLTLSGGARYEKWLGISLDEVSRMKPGKGIWVARFPLIEKRMTRLDCINWMVRQGYPEPPKSACIVCPYRRDERWIEMRESAPEEFEAACRFDEEHRHTVAKHPVYLHRSLVPLRQAQFKAEHEGDLFNAECDGVCNL